MNQLDGRTVFFGLDGVAARLRPVPGDGPGVEVVPYPDVLELLAQLHAGGVRLGLVGGEHPVRLLLNGEGASWFDPTLVVAGDADPLRVFARARRRAAGGRGTPLFVSGRAESRAHAGFAGFLPVPHPSLVPHVLQGNSLRYLRIRVPPEASVEEDWRDALRSLPLIPLHLDLEPFGTVDGPVVFALATATAAARLDDLGFWVDRLGATDLPRETDLYLLHDDRQARSGFLHPEGGSLALLRRAGEDAVLCSTHEGLIVAVRGGVGADEFHLDEAGHGHTRRLGPSPALLEPFDTGEKWLVAGLEDVTAASLSGPEQKTLHAVVSGKGLKADADRYAGLQPLVQGLTVHSRHVCHEHNLRVVLALEAELRNLSTDLAVRLDEVRHRVFNVEATLRARGPGQLHSGVVVVGAHLDSTAGNQLPYHADVDRAPGADDDASGMAGVMAVARAILELRKLDPGRPHREVRFVFFNEEETGFHGSQHYALEACKATTPIIAMFQMDMIGYDADSAGTFELHAGIKGNPVEGASVRVAELVERMAKEVSPRLGAEQYPVPGKRDPGQDRSDHTSFHAQRYPACWVTQDFFEGPPAEKPDQKPNPQYHLPGDLHVDGNYAADIARAVAAAAWWLAVTP